MRSGRSPLIALLCARGPCGDLALPWTRLLSDDLSDLYAKAWQVSNEMPDPSVSLDAWLTLMVDRPGVFDRYVGGLFFVAGLRCATMPGS